MHEDSRLAEEMIRYCILLALSWLLSGCVSIVEVQSDGGKPDVSWWPGGVHVARGSADAVAVTQHAVGASFSQCAGSVIAAAGYTKSSCIVIDPRTCTAAVIFADGNTDTALLDHIAKQARVQCLPKGASQ